MFAKTLLTLATAALTLRAGATLVSNDTDPLLQINITAPDSSAHATFLPFGATMHAFWVKDKYGDFRDILVGFDNLTEYEAERDFFAPVVGRYANRIRNGTFTIPVSKDASGPGQVYHVPENEHNGTNSLHGGDFGFDRRNWSVIDQGDNYVSFSMLDPSGEEGFPGTVLTTVTYTLNNNSLFDMAISATATALTPILLSAHQYWNFEAYNETQTLDDHYAQIKSGYTLAADGNLIPDGSTINIIGTTADFNTGKSIGGAINQTTSGEYCGTDCIGFDNCWIYDPLVQQKQETPVLSIWSTNSGIRLDVVTDQPALQIYTCNSMGTIPRKASQGGSENGTAIYENHSCFVLEQESYLDAINNPEFGVDQIYGPDRPYYWHSQYQFSVYDGSD